MKEFNKIKSLRDKANEIYGQLFALRYPMVEAIYDYLMKKNGKIFLPADIEPIGITYDGGNHPEYAANPYSIVYSVTAKMYNGQKSFSVELNECDDYDKDRMTINDITTILEAVVGEGMHEGDDMASDIDEDEIGQLD